ncbi:hypothetical protein J4457_03280 [Candidatus Woesearchaeota archaeon]|nr:hypothetical protein [Candidatus Woesearchaeota archaeon]
MIKEVVRYFEKYHSAKLANLFRKYLLESCTIIAREKVLGAMRVYHGKIKEKDLEQLAVTKVPGIKYPLSYDRDFEKFQEYTTPKMLVTLLKLKPSPREF